MGGMWRQAFHSKTRSAFFLGSELPSSVLSIIFMWHGRRRFGTKKTSVCLVIKSYLVDILFQAIVKGEE